MADERPAKRQKAIHPIDAANLRSDEDFIIDYVKPRYLELYWYLFEVLLTDLVVPVGRVGVTHPQSKNTSFASHEQVVLQKKTSRHAIVWSKKRAEEIMRTR